MEQLKQPKCGRLRVTRWCRRFNFLLWKGVETAPLELAEHAVR